MLSARTVAFAYGCVDIAQIVFEIILEGELRQQLQVVFVNGALITRLYGE